MITHEPTKEFFDELIKDHDFKSFQLKSSDGDLLVPYNKSTKSPQEQAKSIITKFKRLGDGVYILLANDSFSNSLKPECIYLSKGKIQFNQLSDQQPIQPMRKTKEEKTQDAVMSLESALTRIEETSRLRAENEVLKQRVKDLEIQVNELESEIDDQPELSEEKPMADKVTNWLQTIMPTLAPLADSYFQTQNRKLALEEEKLQNIRRLTFDPISNSRKKKNIKNKHMNSLNNYPDIHNDDELNDYFDMVEKLSDEDFEKLCGLLSIEHPELYEIVTDTFFEDEDDQDDDDNSEGAE